MNVPDELLGVGLLVGDVLGAFGRAGKGSLVMEAVQVTACILEFLYPFLGLRDARQHADSSSRHRSSTLLPREKIHLCNHHVAVERASAVRLGGLVDMPPDLCNDGCSERDVWHKVPVPGSTRQPLVVLMHRRVAYMMSTWSQSAPCSMVREQSWPSWPKSADKIEGAMMVGGAMIGGRLTAAMERVGCGKPGVVDDPWCGVAGLALMSAGLLWWAAGSTGLQLPG